MQGLASGTKGQRSRWACIHLQTAQLLNTYNMAYNEICKECEEERCFHVPSVEIQEYSTDVIVGELRRRGYKGTLVLNIEEVDLV